MSDKRERGLLFVAIPPVYKHPNLAKILNLRKVGVLISLEKSVESRAL